MDIIQSIKDKVRPHSRTVVLPETADDRILKAAHIILDEGFVNLILLGCPESLRNRAREMSLNIERTIIIDPATDARRVAFKNTILAKLGTKGVAKDLADQMTQDPMYFGVLLVQSGEADAQVAGSLSDTADVLRAGLRFIPLRPGIKRISGAFLMISPRPELGEDGVCLFADCAVNPVLTPPQLASVAVESARTFRLIMGCEPRVALLSFSTRGSAEHEHVDRVREITRLAREMAPELAIDGEMQVDAAVIEAVGKRKAPDSAVAGRANVLIFPDLNSGNIGYKIAQRYGGCEAVGPIIQGFSKPINDLSRGTTVNDIVSTVAISALQSLED